MTYQSIVIYEHEERISSVGQTSDLVRPRQDSNAALYDPFLGTGEICRSPMEWSASCGWLSQAVVPCRGLMGSLPSNSPQCLRSPTIPLIQRKQTTKHLIFGSTTQILKWLHNNFNQLNQSLLGDRGDLVILWTLFNRVPTQFGQSNFMNFPWLSQDHFTFFQDCT